MLILRGAPALSAFRLDKLAQKFALVHPDIRLRHTEFVHLAELDGSLAEPRQAVLEQLLEYGPGSQRRRLEELEGASLRHANLSQADLRGATFEGANLEGADLSRANLEKASLWGANLEEARLIKTNLRQANLEMVALWEADLEGADLYGAQMRGAVLGGARITDEQLVEAASLQEATLPDGTKHL